MTEKLYNHVKPYFEQHTAVDTFYVTKDGNVFSNKGNAEAHAFLNEQEVKEITREQFNEFDIPSEIDNDNE